LVDLNTAINGKPLHGMFSDVPPHYDLINSVITWNMDKRWRRLAAETCLSRKPFKILDLCCGTGDLAINIAKLAVYAVEIQGLDFSLPMLERAKRKATGLASLKNLKFVQGEADNMPFPSGYFDCTGISFAFRNLTYKNPLAAAHLSEMLRVLKPGGRLVIVESSQPEIRWIRALDHFYFNWFVAKAGNWLSGNKGAYHYLASSAAAFYTPAELKDLLIRSGFKSVSYRPLFFGAAGIHVAVK
jgi:demethylmenaquinone methyltransferase / 2-methoxy-6-polyprenyl-1,4-benzoquinol methylase